MPLVLMPKRPLHLKVKLFPEMLDVLLIYIFDEPRRVSVMRHPGGQNLLCKLAVKCDVSLWILGGYLLYKTHVKNTRIRRGVDAPSFR